VKITRVTKDESKELQLYATLRSKRKTAEDILNVVNTLRQEMKTFQQATTERDSQQETYQLELTAKLHLLTTMVEKQQQYAAAMYTPGEVEGAPGTTGPGKDYLHSIPFEKVATMARSRSNTWTHISNFVELGSPGPNGHKTATGGSGSPGGSVASAPPSLARAGSAGRIRQRNGQGNGVPPPPSGFSPPIMVTGMRKSLLKNGNTPPPWEAMTNNAGNRRSFRNGSPQIATRKHVQTSPHGGTSPSHARLRRVTEE
jgi:hypothetical protein